VRYHTTGRADMTLMEKIIYLADFIEPGRKHQNCQDLRRAFFEARPHDMTPEERALHIDRIVLESLDSTLGYLKRRGGFISPDTQMARDCLYEQIKHKKNGEN